MNDVLGYIKNNPQETQRLVGLKYEQLEQLINQAIAQGALRRAQSPYISKSKKTWNPRKLEL